MLHRHRVGPRPPRGAARVDVVVGLLLALNALAFLGCAVERVRTPASRTQSNNNLKQLGLGMHSYHDVMKRLPYNGTESATVVDGVTQGGMANRTVLGSGSWLYQLLPYVEQQALYNSQAGTGSGSSEPLAVLLCPARARPGVAVHGFRGPQTDYDINPYLNRPDLLVGDAGDGKACNQPDGNVKIVDVKDGSSNVLFAGHAYFNTKDYGKQNGNERYFGSIFGGGQECTCRVEPGANAAQYRKDNDSSPTSAWGGPYPQGGLFVMVDATVRLFPYSFKLSPFFDSDDGVAAALPD